jgi:hypothetical protein
MQAALTEGGRLPAPVALRVLGAALRWRGGPWTAMKRPPTGTVAIH